MPGRSPWNLADLFEAVVDARPDAEAVAAPGRRLTYAQLDARANRVAHALVERGVEPGARIGLALRNGHEYLEAMFGAFKVRAVPINVNWRYTAEELQHVLADSGAVGVLHEPDLAEPLDGALAPLGRRPWRLARGHEYEAVLSASCDARPCVPDRSGDDRYVLYTGGTTGRPKGVVWRHEDLLFAALGGGNAGGPPAATIAEAVANARGTTRCLPASPFTHGTAHWTALAALFAGGTVVVAADGGFDAAALWELAETEQVTQLVIVGDAFGRPLADALAEEPNRWDLGALVVVVSGGAALSPAVRRAIVERLPWVVVVDGYGTSETGGQGNHVVFPGQADAGPSRFEVAEGTAVLDESLRPLPPGAGRVGLLARTGRIPLGYHGDGAATARTFPVVDGVRWAVPGDLALLGADGRVTLLGRGSSVINTGGEKVHPQEVESTLMEHADVFDAVVVGVPDERFGERVAAVVQPRPGARPATDDLIAHCRAHLAGFKAPRQVVFVDRLRRRESGKPDYGWARRVATSA